MTYVLSYRSAPYVVASVSNELAAVTPAVMAVLKAPDTIGPTPLSKFYMTRIIAS
jgi:hypothetical protein